MEVFDWRITIHDSWLRGDDEFVQVPIPEIYSSPVFALRPTDEEDRVRIASRAGYCRACDGRGAIPAGFAPNPAPMTCPKCKGKGKAMDHPDVRLAIFRHVVGGWSGWQTEEGTEVPFTQENLDRAARHTALFAVVVAKAQTLKVEYRQAVDENLAPGPPASSAAEENNQG